MQYFSNQMSSLALIWKNLVQCLMPQMYNLIYRSFPAMFQRRQSKGKRPFPAPSNVIHAVRNLQLQFCLLPDSTTKTPKNEIRLLQAGLGRRTLSIADNADHEEVLFSILDAFILSKKNLILNFKIKIEKCYNLIWQTNDEEMFDFF